MSTGTSMKKKLFAKIAAAALMATAPFAPAAQEPSPQSPPAQFRISEKEVVAVQVELIRRGYHKSKPSGVLDRETRESLKAFQSSAGLPATGRIDSQTYKRLELKYPATGREAEALRRQGRIPAIGYGVKDKTGAAGRAVAGTANKIKEGAQTGLEKTWDAGSTVIDTTRRTAEGVGSASLRGARTVGRGTQKASTALIGRSDADVQKDVGEMLRSRPETERWVSSVKSGTVTVKIPPQQQADVGSVISNIRKIPGVKSVFVIVL